MWLSLLRLCVFEWVGDDVVAGVRGVQNEVYVE